MADDSDDDVGTDDDDGEPKVLFMREEKIEMRAPWRDALIVKLSGKSLGYTYFVQRLREV